MPLSYQRRAAMVDLRPAVKPFFMALAMALASLRIPMATAQSNGGSGEGCNTGCGGSGGSAPTLPPLAPAPTPAPGEECTAPCINEFIRVCLPEQLQDGSSVQEAYWECRHAINDGELISAGCLAWCRDSPMMLAMRPVTTTTTTTTKTTMTTTTTTISAGYPDALLTVQDFASVTASTTALSHPPAPIQMLATGGLLSTVRGRKDWCVLVASTDFREQRL